MTFGLFSEDKGDCSDKWIIKIAIKTNGIDIDDIIQKNTTYKNRIFWVFFYWFIGL